jgi:lysophospholipase L1-like esterase
MPSVPGSRRNFIKNSTLAGLADAGLTDIRFPFSAPLLPGKKQEQLTLLFQGDSITDGNRGISGNTITDLAGRWQTDTINLKPNVLSIWVGVNDTEVVLKQQEMLNMEKYEEAYRSLVTQTLQALPDCLLVL